MFSKGDGVIHSVYGRGVVTAKRYLGKEYYVHFGKLRVWVPRESLEKTRKVISTYPSTTS